MPTETTTPHNSNSTGVPLVSKLAADPDMVELVRMFVDEIPERIRLVEDFWARRELEQLRRIAHQLKGACGGYGFPQVGQVAARLEDGLSSESEADLQGVAVRVKELIETCRRVRAS
jgi:HPt (histidine-containing phosphotransfer) domain-containing protein